MYWVWFSYLNFGGWRIFVLKEFDLTRGWLYSDYVALSLLDNAFQVVLDCAYDAKLKSKYGYFVGLTISWISVWVIKINQIVIILFFICKYTSLNCAGINNRIRDICKQEPNGSFQTKQEIYLYIWTEQNFFFHFSSYHYSLHLPIVNKLSSFCTTCLLTRL